MRFTRPALIFSSNIILAACQPAEPTAATIPAAAPAKTPLVTAPSTQEMPAPVATQTTAKVTGVVVCDDYLNKYEACLRDKLPEATRAQFQIGLDAMLNSWMQLAANPQTAAALESACGQAKASAAVAMQAYGCTFE